MATSCLLAIAAAAGLVSQVCSQVPQNPSPMVEHTREHPRLSKSVPEGVRHRLSIGTLFLPAAITGSDDNHSPVRVLIHFHGADWIVETAAAASGSAALAVQLGSGSGAYSAPFRESGRFRALLEEAGRRAGTPLGEVTVSGWSAGCRAVREILRHDDDAARIDRVLLLDGIHASYRHGTPGPVESDIVTDPLAPLVRFARLAAAGHKTMLVTHTEIFPGTFASTTETADWLLRELDVPRRAVLEWGPMKTQQLSQASRGRFRLLGFAGNAAPDHIDQLHALPDFLAALEPRP